MIRKALILESRGVIRTPNVTCEGSEMFELGPCSWFSSQECMAEPPTSKANGRAVAPAELPEPFAVAPVTTTEARPGEFISTCHSGCPILAFTSFTNKGLLARLPSR
jgi:hypothetical protein